VRFLIDDLPLAMLQRISVDGRETEDGWGEDVPSHAMKLYRRAEVYNSSFLTSALVGDT